MIQFLHGKSDSVLQLGSGDMELQIRASLAWLLITSEMALQGMHLQHGGAQADLRSR